MFRPRHAYRSPITNRYRGKAKGCPVFNNLNEISSPMVEQHDECLECLAKLKNRSELYKTLADNNKPSNNVIKSLQRLSSSASNNRLKTCLQFLIIKVNEKSITKPKQNTTTTNGISSPKSTVHQIDVTKDASIENYVEVNQTRLDASSPPTTIQTKSKISKRHKSRHHHQPLTSNHQKLNQLASPPQDQVSSTQDQVGPTQDEHDCQTSPLMLTKSHIDDQSHENMVDESTSTTTTTCIKSIDDDGLTSATTSSTTTTTTTYIKLEEDASHHLHRQCNYMNAQSTQSSPPVSSCNSSTMPTDKMMITTINQVSTATSTSTATTSTSPLHIIDYELSPIDKNDSVTKLVVEDYVDSDINFKDQIKTSSLGSNGSTGNSSSSSSNSSSSSSCGKTSSASSSSSSNSSIGSCSNSSTPQNTTIDSDQTNTNDRRMIDISHQQPAVKRRRIQNSASSETSSLASWSLASYGAGSPPSPISSASSTSSLSSTDSMDSELSCYSSTSSTCSSAYTRTSSPLHQLPSLSSSSTSPQLPSRPPQPIEQQSIELKEPRLKLSEDKIRRIKKRPVLFDDYFYTDHIHNNPLQHHNRQRQPSISSTPTTSVGCSPGQQSSMTQNSDQSSRSSSSSSSGGASSNSNFGSSLSGGLGLSTNNMVMHMFQAPPTFVNNLKPCNLPKTKSREPSPQSSTPPITQTKVEMINCAICGIKEKPPKISKIFGQNSCLLCTEFFADFLKNPKQYYCAHDGDCLMTFDSRCQACWIKICLQKFDVDERDRDIGEKYSPKLLLSPNVSLITIDTSVPD